MKETYTLPGVDRYYAIEEGKGLVPSVYDNIVPAGSGKKATIMQAEK